MPFSTVSLQGYSVRRVEMKDSNSVYMTLAFAGVALMAAMVAGVVVLRKRSNRHPHHQVTSHSVATEVIGRLECEQMDNSGATERWNYCFEI